MEVMEVNKLGICCSSILATRETESLLPCPQMLTIKEFDQHIKLLYSYCYLPLAQLLCRLEKKHNGKTVLKPNRKFFSEIARNYPVCKMVQIAGFKQAHDTLLL